jgi:hypothetical protein
LAIRLPAFLILKQFNMKTLKTAIAALLIAGGTIAAFAFTKTDATKENNKKADLYWFDANNNYLGHGNASITGCPDTGSQICARGYSEVNQDDEPVGEVQQTVRKP